MSWGAIRSERELYLETVCRWIMEVPPWVLTEHSFRDAPVGHAADQPLGKLVEAEVVPFRVETGGMGVFWICLRSDSQSLFIFSLLRSWLTQSLSSHEIQNCKGSDKSKECHF